MQGHSGTRKLDCGAAAHYIGHTMPDVKDQRGAKGKRADRLADALRANLRRRKAQARTRARETAERAERKADGAGTEEKH